MTLETEVPMYTLLNLVADVGGYMGLLLGGSVLSAYDFITKPGKERTK